MLEYDEIPDPNKTYICPRCHSSSVEHKLLRNTDDPQSEDDFGWHCSNWKCYGELDFEPHLRFKKEI